jgi:hypothetical protein
MDDAGPSLSAHVPPGRSICFVTVGPKPREVHHLLVARCLPSPGPWWRPSAVMLVNEPTEGLAPMLVQSLTEILATINRRGTTILLVEQTLEVALAFSWRARRMVSGAIRPSSSASWRFSNMWGSDMAPRTPQRSARPDKAGARLDTPGRSSKAGPRLDTTTRS